MRYEEHYRSGGFGYEAERDKWVEWVKRHYVDRFELLGPRKGRRKRPKPRLLDVPCGDGFWTSLFDGLGFEAQGIDLSPAGIEQARSKYPGIRFDVGNAEGELPVEPRSFDVVFSRGITHLHHEDLDRPGTHEMVANLIGYVRPGGQMLVSYYTKRDGESNERHHYHRLSELVRLFEEAGDLWRVDVVNNFVQMSLRPRLGP